MKNKVGYSSFKNLIRFNFVRGMMFTFLLCMFFVKSAGFVRIQDNNYFHIFSGQDELGSVATLDEAMRLIAESRRELAGDSGELKFMDSDFRVEGENVLFGKTDAEITVKERIKAVLTGEDSDIMQHAYTIKVNEYSVNLASIDDVLKLLQAAIDKYDNEGKFVVNLVRDNNHEFAMLTTEVTEKEGAEETADIPRSGGIEDVFAELSRTSDLTGDMDFSDYDLGLKNMSFPDEIEIVETYLSSSKITSLETAIEDVVNEQETPSIYEVVAGDSLSEISMKVNLPMEQIIAMNPDKLDDVFSTIRPGDELVITVPEPKLSIERKEEIYSEEIYDAPVEYIDNDEWYTTQTLVHQQPSAGFRKVVADVTYLNDKVVDKEILKEEVLMEAVPKIVERGTKIPPTYIKPVSGGRLSSGFGGRKAPTKGATSYHKGVDWAVPKGTPVYASSGGVVAKAGWGGGYGYVIYINHADGRQTRYAHLSKIQVKVGQAVRQSEQIALSGSTGVSTGPHVHFEILINGSQVNPLKYIQ